MDDDRHCREESKRRRIKIENNGESDAASDRLSSLPDPILADILSLLSLSSAVSSAVLSRRWRCVWHQLTAIRHCRLPLRLFFTKIFPKLISSSYIDVFEFRNSVIPPIFEFEIRVSQICRNRLKTVELSFRNPRLVLLPSCVFECQTLESLVLGEGFDIKLPENDIKLPNLRKLHIGVRHDSLIMMKRPLFGSCPLLEDLWVRWESVDDYALYIHISGLNLKRLRLSMKQKNRKDPVLQIDAPKLEHFHVESLNLLKCLFVKTPRFLVKVKLFIGSSQEQVPSWGFLQFSCYSVKTLSLSGDMLAPIYYMIEGPVFYSVTKLKIELKFPACWKPLMRFLSSCPSLQVLVIRRGSGFEWGAINWSQLSARFPTCLSTKIKRVKLQNLRGEKSELGLISFVLSVAKVLETLDVSVVGAGNEGKELGFCREVFVFPRSSPTCQISFSGEYINNVSSKDMKVEDLDSCIQCST